MKILFLSRLFWPHVGGIEKHLEEVGKFLVKEGHEVTIVTTKFKSILPSEDTYKNIKIRRFQQPNIKFVGLFWTWLWLLKNIDLIKQSDIIHCHDMFIWYLPFRFLFPNKPVYITFHGQWGKCPIPKKDIFQKKLGAKLSSGNICIGDYIPKNYGIKADILSYGATKIPKSVGKKREDLILYVGRLDKNTGLPTFLKALKDSKHWEVEFCGDGELKKECVKYGKVHGFVNPEPHYQKARYFFASGYLTIMEALAHKCLVFAAYGHPLQEDYYKLAPFSKFIVITKNSEDVTNKLRYYQRNKKAAQELINNGFNWVKKQTWQKMTEDYLRLWDEI